MNFNGLTVFVLANNETDLLVTTINSIKSFCVPNDLHRIVIVAKNRNCLSYTVADELSCSDPVVELYVQQAPTAQLCLAELPGLVTSSHFVIMAADMEMSPANLPVFISSAKKHPDRIICAAKWMKGSTVIGYGMLHAFCSKTMNKIISIILNKKVYDPFSIYQIYPVDLYKKMNFENPKNFLYEYTLKPLSEGFEYEEVPTVYKKRKEGKTNFNLLTLIFVGAKFLATGFRIRFKLQVRRKCN